jgi:5-methylcytosine-specific restriction enzyme subunit McrC
MIGLEAVDENRTEESLEPIHLVEYGRSDPLNDRQWRALQAAKDARGRLGLSLDLDDQTPQQSDRLMAQLVAGPIIGAVRIEHEDDKFEVFVRPKITDANFFTMFDYAYWADQLRSPLRLNDPVSLEQLSGNVTGLVIRLFLYRLEQFSRRHLRRDYILRREPLNSRVRGKILTQEYMRHSLPRLRDYVVPCQFSELSRDTLSNCILLWTLHLCARAVAAFPLEQRRVLLPKIAARRQALGGITLTPIRLSDFRRVRYSGLNAVYRPIHALCRFIIEQFQFENVAGEAEFREFSLDMNDLFERFVRGVLRTHLGGRFVADKRRLTWRYDLGVNGRRKRIELDGLIRDETGQAQCVIECKYREVWEATGSEDEVLEVSGGKLRNSEIFQTIAYATHQAIRAPAAVLVYPVTNGDVSILGPIRDFGLRPESDEPVSLYVVGIDIGGHLHKGMDAFVKLVQEAVQSRLVDAARELW